jgi:pyridinium-3,5-bisthiocarboxylic acid mononucleotide nickel chelatase
VPAPATARILDGFEWRDDGVGGERVTPTGAAILRHLGVGASRSGGKLAGTGMGAGTRDLPGMPNILRALVFESAAGVADAQTVAVLSFDIDDMTGEEIGVAAELLRAAGGVLDVALAALSGKKGRPLVEFRLLVRPEALNAVQQLCFIETSTIGLRWRIERRATLGRSVDTAASAIRVKRVDRPDGAATAKAESDDLTTIDSLARRRAAKAEAER